MPAPENPKVVAPEVHQEVVKCDRGVNTGERTPRKETNYCKVNYIFQTCFCFPHIIAGSTGKMCEY